MNAAKYEKWESFYRLAMSYFNHLGRAGDVEFIKEPVSEQITSVKVYKVAEQSAAVEQMVWESGTDFQKFRNSNTPPQLLLREFTPTITTQTYPLDYQDYQELLDLTQGLAFTMPISPKPEYVIRDGTHHELRLHHFSGKISFKWHSDLPETWYMLQPVLDKVEELSLRFFAKVVEKK